MSSTVVLDEIFSIESVDNSRYDRVSRLSGRTALEDIKLTLDINRQIFPVAKNQNLNLKIASLIDDEELKQSAEYICFGKVYRIEESGDDSLAIYASFGGLLICLNGAQTKLGQIPHDYIYLLLR